MSKDLSQDWINWILENVLKGCDKNELLEILLKEGFDSTQCRIALGLELKIDDINEKGIIKKKPNYNIKNISAKRIEDLPLEIYEVEDFLSEDECELIIKEIKSSLRPSTIASAGAHDETYRTSSTCDLGIKNNEFLKEIDRRICHFIGIEPSFGETLQGQFYLEGQEFKEHTDYFEGSQLLEHDQGKGQRTFTFMIYLNDVSKGGETEFTKIDKKFKPLRGNAIIWNNLNEDGSTNENTMHQAHPVIEGEKVIITKWFRQASPNLQDKIELNKHVKTYTKKGFKKTKLEEKLHLAISKYYFENEKNLENEYVAGNFIESDKNIVPSLLLELPIELKQRIHDNLQKPLEKWCGVDLTPTYVYGIREYREGSILNSHRDRKDTHIISAIINVHQEVSEEWPLEIEDHFYRKHEVFLEPGEVIFYESARLLHGRPKKLKGKRFANIFCHYMPKGA